VVPDDVLLFRYSALTFNGHRIHYDRRYVTQVEGYPGLIVHGPLIATLLVDLVRRHAPDAFVKGFQFKAVRPTFRPAPVPPERPALSRRAHGAGLGAGPRRLADHAGRRAAGLRANPAIDPALHHSHFPMNHTHDAYQDIRDAVRDLCAQFPDEYFRKVDEARGYPEAFVDALTRAGWMAALIPQDYGGSGLGLAEASVIMEEINRCGGNSGACHGQMYNMGTLLRSGSEAQKEKYLPKIATGELRLQSMGVTEPTTGTDTTKIKTTAVKKGDRYVVNGQKVWISRIQHRPDDPAGAHHAAGRREEEAPKACRSSSSTCAMPSARG
jgi:hypothetical protein